MRLRTFSLIICVLALNACTSYRAPNLRTTPIPVTSVDASAGRTWDALVEYVAGRLLTIEVIDRSSGLLAVGTREGFSSTEAPRRSAALVVGDTTVANCGSEGSFRFGAEQARYNVLVRGDSVKSSVTVNAMFKAPGITSYRWCVSTGRFEQVLGERIRDAVRGTP